MIGFWTSFAFVAVSWCLALIISGVNGVTILLSAVFFTFYFVLPIITYRTAHVVMFILPLLTAWTFYASEWNPFVWIIYLMLATQAVSRYEEIILHSYMSMLIVLAVLPHLLTQEWVDAGFVFVLALTIGTLIYEWEKSKQNERDIHEQYDVIYDEYRLMKRDHANAEELARQEERNQIAREIHDSVGHRLTALMMQLEVAKLQAADEETKTKFNELKKLAQTSLHDTREAVKTLKSEETAGLQAIIQLVRKLESESHIRVSMTLQSGVLNVLLSNQQSVTVYRSIQEALTNMMRHSTSRQAEIKFQIVAQHDFRFSVKHHLSEKVSIKEGFGLTSMRERLSQIGGRMTINQQDGDLEVICQFPLEGKNND